MQYLTQIYFPRGSIIYILSTGRAYLKLQMQASATHAELYNRGIYDMLLLSSSSNIMCNTEICCTMDLYMLNTKFTLEEATLHKWNLYYIDIDTYS